MNLESPKSETKARSGRKPANEYAFASFFLLFALFFKRRDKTIKPVMISRIEMNKRILNNSSASCLFVKYLVSAVFNVLSAAEFTLSFCSSLSAS